MSVSWRSFPADHGEKWRTPWTGCQQITGGTVIMGNEKEITTIIKQQKKVFLN